MVLEFDSRGNDKQKKVFEYWADNETDEIAYGGSKGSGKSYVGCSIIFGQALMYAGTHWFIARESLTDLRNYTIPSIHEVLGNYGIGSHYYKYNGRDNYFTLANGSRIYLLAAKHLPSDPRFERFGSMQFTGGWIEEGGAFSSDAYKYLKISIGRWKNSEYGLMGKLLITCNPSKNFLYTDFYKPNKEGTLETRKKFIQALPQDNKMLPPGYLQNLYNTLDGSERKRLLEGNWEYDDSPNALLQYEQILDIFTNEKEGKGKYLVCDPAGEGKDEMYLVVFDGFQIIDYEIWNKSSGKEVRDAINKMRVKHKVPNRNICYDAIGVGHSASGWFNGSISFVSGANPISYIFIKDGKEIPKMRKGAQKKKKYDTIRDECGYKLAELISDDIISINEGLMPKNIREQIILELEHLKSNNKDLNKPKKIISKDLIKLEISRSPGWMDILIMRMIFVVSKSTKKRRTRSEAI